MFADGVVQYKQVSASLSKQLLAASETAGLSQHLRGAAGVLIFSSTNASMAWWCVGTSQHRTCMYCAVHTYVSRLGCLSQQLFTRSAVELQAHNTSDTAVCYASAYGEQMPELRHTPDAHHSKQTQTLMCCNFPAGAGWQPIPARQPAEESGRHLPARVPAHLPLISQRRGLGWHVWCWAV
jgi:hypothetical protein